MACFITIGKVNKYIIFPIVGGILEFIFKYLISISTITTDNHGTILCFCSSLGMSFSFILFLIYKYKNKTLTSKTNNKNIIKSKLLIELEYNDQEEIIKYHKYIYILITAILTTLLNITSDIYIPKVTVNFWTFDILFIALFSYLIFRIKIYKHQYICILIFIATGLIFDIYLGIHGSTINGNLNNIEYIIIKFLGEIIFSLIMVINKFIMEKKFCSPYELCFLQGIICLLLTSLYLIIFPSNFKSYWEKIAWSELLLFSFILIIEFLYNIIILITIQNFTTFHILICIIISEIEPFIEDSNNDGWTLVIAIFIYIFIFFILLIFIEVFELNFCGLQDNTKKNITERAENEKNLNDIDAIRNDSESEGINDEGEIEDN